MNRTVGKKSEQRRTPKLHMSDAGEGLPPLSTSGASCLIGREDDERERERSRNVTMKRCPTLMKCRESPHGMYYISPLMTEHMLSVYLYHVLAK